jgi:hypothetical protein
MITISTFSAKVSKGETSLGEGAPEGIGTASHVPRQRHLRHQRELHLRCQGRRPPEKKPYHHLLWLHLVRHNKLWL